MSGQQLYAESLSANMFLPGQVQAFTFDMPLSQWQLVNNFTPTSITDCHSLFEFINTNDSGYRFHQSTSNTAQRGDFILEQFNNGTIPGTPLFTIQESTGDFVFSPQSGGAIQINNGNSVTPLQFYNSAGTHYVAFQAGNLSSNIAWTLPTTDSTGIQALVSNGAGIFSWESFLPLSGGTLTGPLILNADPTNALGAVTKQYADAIGMGMTFKDACYAATTVNLLATYLNGVSGVGATLTNAGSLAAFSIDGVSPPLNSRILVKNQSTAFQNGIYTLTTVGNGLAAWVLTRSTDYNQASEIAPGDFILIDNGTINENTAWIETATVNTIGTDSISFSQFGNPGTVTLVSGTSGQIDVVNGTSTPAISIDPGYVGQSSITTLGTIMTGTWNASLIPIAYGGTNASTASGALANLGAAPNNATYIIQTADASLPNAQVLASLSTGIVKNTTTTGVLNIAIAGTDYYAPGYPTEIYDTSVHGGGSLGIGYGALGTNPNTIGGTQNCAFGRNCLNSLSPTNNGYENSGFGFNALVSLTTGFLNAAFGQSSMLSSTTSSYTSAFGTLSGNAQANYTQCTFLGFGADASVNNLTNATAIGWNASVGASNSMVLGSGVNVGIGTSTPAYLLDVNGEINGIWNGSIIGLPYGGTNANLTASNGGIVYSTASALSVLAGTVTARQVLLSGSSTAPTWSTATYPSTTTINQLLYSSANNVISVLATANNSVLLTNGSGVPAWATLTSSVVTSISGTANQITASASTGAVTLSLPSSVIITTSLTAGNLELTGNILQSNNTNGSISIAPNGSGNILMLPSGSTGFVGINQASPHSPLHFANSVNNRIITLFEVTNNAYQYYGFGIQNNILVYNVPALTNFHVFYAGTSSTTSQELMRITATGTTGNSGCIGINVGATPSAGCHVIGGVQNVSGEDTCFRAQSSSNSAKMEFDSTSASGRLYEVRSTSTGIFDIVDRTGNAERLIINTTGVGIFGTPDTTFSVTTGSADKPGGGTWGSFSDARIKDILYEYNHGLTEILKINPKVYKYSEASRLSNEDQEIVRIGIIAQEIETIMPECVTIKNAKGIEDLRYFDASPLTYAMINAIKELNLKVEKLRSQIQ